MELKTKNAYTYQDLLDCANGKLFGEGNAKLPAPNMLMMDQITHISQSGGKYDKGEIKAFNITIFPENRKIRIIGQHFVDAICQ